MTKKEAIKIFNEVLLFGKAHCTQAEFKELAKMSIQALEQETRSEWQKDHEILKAYSDGANEVLDKIRAEIGNINLNEVAEKYEDRFYGFQREVIKIIDKHKGESEG